MNVEIFFFRKGGRGLEILYSIHDTSTPPSSSVVLRPTTSTIHQTYISSCRLFVYSVYLKKILSVTGTILLPLPILFSEILENLIFIPLFCKAGNHVITFPSPKFRVVQSKGVGNFDSVFIKWREKYFHSIQEKGKCLRKGFLLYLQFQNFQLDTSFSIFLKKVVFLYIHVKFKLH